jgi:hypothetical protein
VIHIRSSEPMEPSATLYLVCPWDHLTVIVAWSCDARDPDFIWQEPGGHTIEEMIAPQNMPQAALIDIGITPPVAEPDAGDEPHLRVRFPCPRPSCSYEAQVRADRINAESTRILRQMLEEGIRGRVVTHVDRDSWTVLLPNTESGPRI